jgi:hypothetical protein
MMNLKPDISFQEVIMIRMVLVVFICTVINADGIMKGKIGKCVNEITYEKIDSVINPAPSHTMVVDTVTNTTNVIKQIIMHSDSIGVYVRSVDSYGNLASIEDCKWTVTDSTQLSVEKSADTGLMYLIKVKQKSIDTDVIFNINSMYSDTIQILKFHASSTSFKQPKTSTGRYPNVASFDLLGKKNVNFKMKNSGCILLHLNTVNGQSVSVNTEMLNEINTILLTHVLYHNCSLRRRKYL